MNATLILGDSNAVNGSPTWPGRLSTLRPDLGTVGGNALTGRTALDGLTVVDGQLAFAQASGATVKNYIIALGTNYNALVGYQSPLETAITLRQIAEHVAAFSAQSNVGYPVSVWIATIAPKLLAPTSADHGRQVSRYLAEMAASPGVRFGIIDFRDVFTRDPAALSELTTGDKVHYGPLAREAIAALCAGTLP